MPNDIRKGVVYHSGKFHISKLTTDVAEFMGPVQSQTGVVLDASQASGQGAESFIMPTATQVVDYVTSSISANSTYGLDAQSASSGESFAFSLSAQADSLSEKERMDNSRSEILGEIASAMSQAETLVNTVEASAGLNTSGGYITLADRSVSGLATDGWYIHGASSLANADKKLDEALHAEELARIAQDDVIEASVGLDAAGAYVAPTALNSDVWSPIQTYVDDGTNITRVAKADMATATTVKEADAILRSLIQTVDEKLEFVISGAGVDLNTLVELVNNYNALDTDILTTITSMANLVGLGITDTNPTDGIQDGGQGFTLAAMPEASVTDGSVTKSFPELVFGSDADAGKASTLKSMVEKTRAKAAELMVAMQVELDASQAGAGLDSAGAYVSHGAAIYLGAETTLAGADLVLDGAIGDIQDKIDNMGSGTSDKLDAWFAGAHGGALVGEITADYSIVDALNHIASESGAGFTGLQAELDRTQAAIGFDLAGANADGSDYSPALAYGANYFVAKTPVAATSLIEELDSFFAQAHTALKGFEAGTGLGQDGAYTANGSANYISTAVSLQDADNKLDAALEVHSVEIDNLIAATGMSSAPASKGAFVPYTGVILATAGTMYDADVALESELVRIAGDLYADPANPFGGFTIAGGTQSTFEEAINALDTMIGEDGNLEVAGDTGTGTVDLSSETYMVKGGASADAAGSVNIATSWDDSGKELSVVLDANPKAVTFSADQKVQAPIHSSKVKVHDAPMEASDVINAGDVIALDMSGNYTIANGGWAAVKRADKTVGATDLSKIVGIAFDPSSTNGELSLPVAPATETFSAGDMVAFITEGVIKGFDLSGCTTPAAGQELYLDANGKVTNAAPSGDGSTSTDYVSIHKIGMIMVVGATFADNVVMIDMKHIANDQ